MFKVYKWFVYYLLRPHKIFEHLLKYLAIYFAKLNKLQKNRKESLNRIKKKAYLSPGARPSRPSPPGPALSSSTGSQAAACPACRRRRHAPACLEPPRASFSRLDVSWRRTRSLLSL